MVPVVSAALWATLAWAPSQVAGTRDIVRVGPFTLQQSEGLAWPAPSQLSLGGPIPRRASRLTLLADLDRAGAVALDLLGIRADEEALARTGEPVPVLRPELQAALVYTPPRSPLRLSVGSSLQAAGSLARTLRGLGSRPKQVSFGMRL